MQQTIKLPLEGEVAAARDAVGRVYSSTLRRLHGLIHETDITKLPRFMLVTAQQSYMAVRPEGVPSHVFFRNAGQPPFPIVHPILPCIPHPPYRIPHLQCPIPHALSRTPDIIYYKCHTLYK